MLNLTQQGGTSKISQLSGKNVANINSVASRSHISLSQGGYSNNADISINGGLTNDQMYLDSRGSSMLSALDCSVADSPFVRQTGNLNTVKVTMTQTEMQQGQSAGRVVDQSGDNNSTTVNARGLSNYIITQIGASNTATADLNNDYIVGSDNIRGADFINSNIRQTGNSNAASITGKQDADVSLSITQKGNLNKATLVHDTKTSNYGNGHGIYSASIAQEGNNNTANLHSSGSFNNTSIYQKGDGNQAEIELYGQLNTAYINQTGNYNTGKIEVGGANESKLSQSNQAFINQTGNYNSGTIDASGVGNQIGLSQNGSYNESSITDTGNSNTINVTQTGTYNSAPVNVTGNGNKIDVTQTGKNINLSTAGTAYSTTTGLNVVADNKVLSIKQTK